MPNHTSQVLYLNGPLDSCQRVRELVTTDNGEFDANAVIPMPEELRAVHMGARTIDGEMCRKWVETPGDDGEIVYIPVTRSMSMEWTRKYGADNWYSWACANWGTKWGIYDADWRSDTEVFFMSAWSPACPVIDALSEMFQDIEFTLEYADEGGGFLGSSVFVAGEAVSDTSLVWDSPEGIEVRERLGCYYPKDEQDDLE